MQDRLTIDRPVALRSALAAAVRAVCAQPITVAPEHIHLIDARHACGDFEAVLAALRAATPSPALPLFVARYVRWSGDLHSATAIWSDVLASLELALSDSTTPALRHAACAELAPVATDLGDAQLAARLLGIARTTDAGDFPTHDNPDTEFVRHIAFTALGIEPDAARGRLRLRPRLDQMDELSARNIRFGDGSVRIGATRAGGRLTIRVEQDAGGIPITLLLEPFVRGHRTATVDGRAADLHSQTLAGGTILPVQLVLDEARTLVVEEYEQIAQA